METCTFYSESGNPLPHNVTAKVIMYMHSHIFQFRKKKKLSSLHSGLQLKETFKYRLDSLKLIFSAHYW